MAVQNLPFPLTFACQIWQNQEQRAPFIFSISLHFALFIALFIPTNFFSFQRPLPEVYTVDLIDLSEPEVEPETEPPVTKVTPPPKPRPKPKVQKLSTTPPLSSRVMPKPPTEIKIIRPRAAKKIMRHKRDSTSILAGLARMQTHEKLDKELKEAEAKAETENKKAMEMMAQAIMTRPSRETTAPVDNQATTVRSTSKPTQGRGISATNAMQIYSAAVRLQISENWVLPEGQQWDETLLTVLIVKIREDGIVLSHTFKKRSGNIQFDKFVSQTLEKASPLPMLPVELAEENYSLRLNFYPRGLQ